MTNKSIRYKKQFELNGRVAVVTGATGILGKKFCSGLAEFGAKVVVVDIDKGQVENFSKILENRYGTECLGLVCDVSDADSVKKQLNILKKLLVQLIYYTIMQQQKVRILKNFLLHLRSMR